MLVVSLNGALVFPLTIGLTHGLWMLTILFAVLWPLLSISFCCVYSFELFQAGPASHRETSHPYTHNVPDIPAEVSELGFDRLSNIRFSCFTPVCPWFFSCTPGLILLYRRFHGSFYIFKQT